MGIRYSGDLMHYKSMDTAELRASYLIEGFFPKGELHLEYLDPERFIAGSIVPLDNGLSLLPGREMAADYFCQRREMGVLNIGGPGMVAVDNTEYPMDHLSCLYIGRESRDIEFFSKSLEKPAMFYFVSLPAHKKFPAACCCHKDALATEIGSNSGADRRSIFKYICNDRIKSCQLVMGVTMLADGSVWNSMPPHTHERRSEIYLYFDLAPKTCVFHFMGTGEETRHLIVRDHEAVLSPPWSIHAGAGMSSYSFCWAMGGENQDFSDMDAINMDTMK